MSHPTSKPINFDSFQHQSEIGAVVDFFFLLRRNLRGMLFLTLYLLFKLEWHQYYWIGIGYLLLIGLLSLSAYLSYKNTTYKIAKSSGEFQLNKGIFNKSKVSIQLDKIIQVNINQNFIQRMLNVYSVAIETAGSVKSEATIKALDKEVAFALKQALLREALISNEENTSIPTETTLDSVHNRIFIAPLQLVKYAFTTDYIRSSLIMIGILFSFYSRIQEYLQNFRSYEEDFENAAIAFYETQSVFVLIGGLFIVAILVNAVRNIVQYFQMEIKMNQETTWITYGLLGRKNTVLQNDRTQLFNIYSNPIQRLLNVYKLEITQISSNIEADKKAKITVAGAARNQIEQLFGHIFHTAIPEGIKYLSGNLRMLILPFLFTAVLPLVSFFILVNNDVIPIVYAWFLLFYFLILVPLLYRYFSNYELRLVDGFIIKKQKIWKDKTQIIALDKIQSIYTEQYIWQKGSNLGNLIIQTAGGNIVFKYADFDKVQLLSNYLLYKVEDVK